MSQSNPDAENPVKWRGQNLLGFALTEARDEVAEVVFGRIEGDCLKVMFESEITVLNDLIISDGKFSIDSN